jgi:16S rRNA (uracil1498-N3)-methyltransferase
VIIGPEVYFSEIEINLIIDLKQTHSISLAKNILRAETAALSAITIVNYHLNLS